MPHQQAALERLKQTGGRQLLHIGCGGGKTLTTLQYIKDSELKSVLIVAPATLLGVWIDEGRKWFDWTIKPIKGDPKKRKEIYDLWSDGIYVVGYETMLKDIKHLLAKKFDLIVSEESHKIKNPTAKCTKAMFKLGSKSPHRVALSGTAMPGGFKDIWSQTQFIEPGCVSPSWWTFRSEYCVMPIQNIPVIKGYRSLDKLKSLIKPWVFTVPKEDIDKNLPDVTFQDIRLDLSEDEWKLYKQMRDELRLMLKNDEELTIPSCLVFLGRLRQLVNGSFSFGLDVKSTKMEALKELVESIPQDEKIIVFSQYAVTAKQIQKELNTPYLVYENSKDKEDIVKRWKSQGRILVGTGSLGTGWNLQDASYCVNYELPYTNAEYEQRISRLIRVGQLRHVHVYNLLTNGTIDSHVEKILKDKKDMTDDFIEWTKGDVAELLS